MDVASRETRRCSCLSSRLEHHRGCGITPFIQVYLGVFVVDKRRTVRLPPPRFEI